MILLFTNDFSHFIGANCKKDEREVKIDDIDLKKKLFYRIVLEN